MNLSCLYIYIPNILNNYTYNRNNISNQNNIPLMFVSWMCLSRWFISSWPNFELKLYGTLHIHSVGVLQWLIVFLLANNTYMLCRFLSKNRVWNEFQNSYRYSAPSFFGGSTIRTSLINMLYLEHINVGWPLRNFLRMHVSENKTCWSDSC